MKKTTLIFAILLFSKIAFSQVGINTSSPNTSSMLDITATDKGLLIPRISIPNLNAAAPVTSPVVSLLVYNTNATTGVGYYYWDGLKWTALATGIPQMASFQGMRIPICNSVFIGATGSFTIPIRGVSTTVNWTVSDRQVASGSSAGLALAPVKAERLQVRYDFTPALPFNPVAMIFNVNNNGGFPDTFLLNYVAKSQSSITINVTRADVFANSMASPCWQGQFYFDVLITN